MPIIWFSFPGTDLTNAKVTDNLDGDKDVTPAPDNSTGANSTVYFPKPVGNYKPGSEGYGIPVKGSDYDFRRGLVTISCVIDGKAVDEKRIHVQDGGNYIPVRYSITEISDFVVKQIPKQRGSK